MFSDDILEDIITLLRHLMHSPDTDTNIIQQEGSKALSLS